MSPGPTRCSTARWPIRVEPRACGSRGFVSLPRVLPVHNPGMKSHVQITQRVVDAILAQTLPPCERLGEQDLADHFGVSRTLVREALMQLQARGFVEVRSRKGWFVVEPSLDDAKDAFQARRAVEAGMLRDTGRPLQTVLRRLHKHVQDERDAIEHADAATRAFLLADFHVCLAECLGHRILAELLRDLTARTTLAATLYQSTHDARQSCDEHQDIVKALRAGDIAAAQQLMLEHIGNVEAALGESMGGAADQQARLSRALLPVAARPGPRAA